jgi:hypothetical protein
MGKFEDMIQHAYGTLREATTDTDGKVDAEEIAAVKQKAREGDPKALQVAKDLDKKADLAVKDAEKSLKK